MKYSALLLLLALLGGGCAEDPEIRDLKAVSAQQRGQVDRLLLSQQVVLDQLAVQLGREAQAEAESETASRFHDLGTGALVVLGCGLAVTIALLVRKRGAHVPRPG